MAQAIHIHAGAHRTGTSSFQLMLAENRAVLMSHGVLALYPGRDGAPGGTLRLRMPGPNAGKRKQKAHSRMVRETLARHLGGADPAPRVVLSEENIPGRMLHFFSGQFFPAAPMRLKMLAEALAEQGIARPTRLVYVVRSYADLFVSAYRKRAEDNPLAPFRDLAPAMAAMQGGWPDLMTQIQTHLRPEILIALTYPRRRRSVDLLGLVLGDTMDGLEEPARLVNLSATDTALEALQARYHAGERLDRQSWQAVLAEHADMKEPHDFAAFNADQKARLDARYHGDCETLEAMPGVTFLG